MGKTKKLAFDLGSQKKYYFWRETVSRLTVCHSQGGCADGFSIVVHSTTFVCVGLSSGHFVNLEIQDVDSHPMEAFHSSSGLTDLTIAPVCLVIRHSPAECTPLWICHIYSGTSLCLKVFLWSVSMTPLALESLSLWL